MEKVPTVSYTSRSIGSSTWSHPNGACRRRFRAIVPCCATSSPSGPAREPAWLSGTSLRRLISSAFASQSKLVRWLRSGHRHGSSHGMAVASCASSDAMVFSSVCILCCVAASEAAFQQRVKKKSLVRVEVEGVDCAHEEYMECVWTSGAGTCLPAGSSTS